MPERAQLTTGGIVRWLVTAPIVVTVLYLVVQQMATAAVTAGDVTHYCGLCHVEWWRPLGVFSVATGLTVAAYWLLRRGPEVVGDA